MYADSNILYIATNSYAYSANIHKVQSAGILGLQKITTWPPTTTETKMCTKYYIVLHIICGYGYFGVLVILHSHLTLPCMS